jgi:hypothetical protein
MAEVWDGTNGGGGVYETGPRNGETVDSHASAVERFSDDGGQMVPWTAELALRVLGVRRKSRAEQEAVILAAEKRLSREAYEALRDAGYPVPDGVL